MSNHPVSIDPSSKILVENPLGSYASVPYEAGEGLDAGDFVNIYDVTGTPKVRKANGASATPRPAHGFVLTGAIAAGTVEVFLDGINSKIPIGTHVAADVGSKVWLSTSTAGAITTTTPTGSGNLKHFLGRIIKVDTDLDLISVSFSITEEITL